MKQQRIKANTVCQKYDKSILMKSICAIWECDRIQLIFQLILKYQHNFLLISSGLLTGDGSFAICSQSSMNGRIHPMDSPINNCRAQLTSVINPLNCWDWSARSNVHRRARQWRGYQLARILIFGGFRPACCYFHFLSILFTPDSNTSTTTAPTPPPPTKAHSQAPMFM